MTDFLAALTEQEIEIFDNMGVLDYIDDLKAENIQLVKRVQYWSQLTKEARGTPRGHKCDSCGQYNAPVCFNCGYDMRGPQS